MRSRGRIRGRLRARRCRYGEADGGAWRLFLVFVGERGFTMA